MTDATLKETCSCGATLEYTGTYPNTISHNWREQHKHVTVNGVLVVPEGVKALDFSSTTEEETKEK